MQYDILKDEGCQAFNVSVQWYALLITDALLATNDAVMVLCQPSRSVVCGQYETFAVATTALIPISAKIYTAEYHSKSIPFLSNRWCNTAI